MGGAKIGELRSLETSVMGVDDLEGRELDVFAELAEESLATETYCFAESVELCPWKAKHGIGKEMSSRKTITNRQGLHHSLHKST